MKRKLFAMILSLAAIAILLGAASASESLKSAELNLISHGGFPQESPVQAYAVDDFDDYLYDQLLQQRESIDLFQYGMTIDVFKARLESLCNNRPRLFFVGNRFSYYQNSDQTIIRLLPEYLFTGADLQNRLAAFDASVQAIADYASAATTDVGKLLRANDYFSVHFDYDNSLSIYRPDQLFSGGTGVCQAQMLAYAAVLDALEIPHTHAVSASMRHIWNVVELDGSWYHLDVTWNNSQQALRARHAYFLLSDAACAQSDHYDWVSPAACFDERYDSFFWRGLNAPLGVSGESIYYMDSSVIDGARAILGWNAATGESSVVYRFSMKNGDESFPYDSACAPICADGDRIYFAAGNRLQSIDFSGENAALIHLNADAESYIWSCWLEGDTIYMRASDWVGSENCAVLSCDSGNRIKLTVSPRLIRLSAGESVQIEARLSVDGFDPLPIAWSSDTSAVSVDANGCITAAASGVALVQASFCEGAQSHAAVIVEGAEALNPPDALQTIQAEAFQNTAAHMIVLPEGVQSIDSRAFADSEYLKLVFMPDRLQFIAANAFENSDSAMIVCSEGSYAQAYAESAGIDFIVEE